MGSLRYLGKSSATKSCMRFINVIAEDKEANDHSESF